MAAAPALWIFPGLGAGTRSVTSGAAPPSRPQPASIALPTLLAASLSGIGACLRQGARPAAVLGHSFGELAAIVAAGALEPEAALVLARVRGSAMDRLAGGGHMMAAVLGVEAHIVARECRDLEKHGPIQIVANNSPTQNVVGGRSDLVIEAGHRCRAMGAIRVILLPLSL